MANLTTLSSGSSVVLTVTEQQQVVLNNGRTDVARLQITTGPGAGTVVTASHNGRRVYGPFGAGTVTLSAVSGDVRYELSGDSISPLDDDVQPLTSTENQTVRALVSAPWNKNTIVYLGDSNTANGYNLASADNVLTADDGWSAWFEVFGGHALKRLNVAATSGHTTAQMLARLDADVLAYSPGWCAVMGGTNDANTTTTVGAITANLEAIYDRLNAAGIRVLALTIYPYGSSYAGFTVAKNLVIMGVNRWIKDYATRTGKIVVCDAYAALIDKTATTPTVTSGNLKADDLHTSAQGARRVGYAAWLAMADHVDDRGYHVVNQADRYDYDATSPQLQSNPLMQGSEAATAPVTGTEATGLIVERSGGTATIAASVAARADGFGNDQVATISATALNDVVQIRMPSITARVFAGQTLRGEMYVSCTGMTNVRSLYAEISITIGGSGYTARCLNESVTTMDNGDIVDAVFRLPDVVLPATAGTVTFATMLMRVEFGGVGGCVLKVGRASTLVVS